MLDTQISGFFSVNFFMLPYMPMMLLANCVLDTIESAVSFNQFII